MYVVLPTYNKQHQDNGWMSYDVTQLWQDLATGLDTTGKGWFP